MDAETGVGQLGVWSSALRIGDMGEAREAAVELEELGYRTIWIPGRTADVFERADALLAATTRIVVATGIVNVWEKPARETAEAQDRLRASYPARFLLGIGISHAPLVPQYGSPLRTMRDYLDILDRESEAPPSGRVLAALAPRMLELARTRAAGSHPYLVPVAHTRAARDALGPDSLLAPELGVVLETDPEQARAIARRHLETYLRFPNYVRNWLRHGFTDDDVRDGCSNRLVDALIAWGDVEAIGARVAEHRAAGADHVALQVLSEDSQSFHREAWRALAPVAA